MARQIQMRRGTASEHSAFTGAVGEITVDTTNKTLRVHDGETPGGFSLARADQVATDLSKIPEEKARQLIGNRIWVSGLYSLSSSANTVITHNLGLSQPTRAIAIPYAQFTTARDGYSVGDVISCFNIVAYGQRPSGSMESICGYSPFLNVATNTVVLPKAGYEAYGIYTFNKNTGAKVLEIPVSAFKIFVKIIY